MISIGPLLGSGAPAANSSGVGSPAWKNSTSAPSPVMTATRQTSIQPTRRRRSNRSVITPAGRLKNNHGILLATPTMAISSASRVTAEANQTRATDIRPSPRFAALDEANSLR